MPCGVPSLANLDLQRCWYPKPYISNARSDIKMSDSVVATCEFERLLLVINSYPNQCQAIMSRGDNTTYETSICDSHKPSSWRRLVDNSVRYVLTMTLALLTLAVVDLLIVTKPGQGQERCEFLLFMSTVPIFFSIWCVMPSEIRKEAR